MTPIFLNLVQLRIITPSSADNADTSNEIINKVKRTGEVFLIPLDGRKSPFTLLDHIYTILNVLFLQDTLSSPLRCRILKKIYLMTASAK